MHYHMQPFRIVVVMHGQCSHTYRIHYTPYSTLVLRVIEDALVVRAAVNATKRTETSDKIDCMNVHADGRSIHMYPEVPNRQKYTHLTYPEVPNRSVYIQ